MSNSAATTKARHLQQVPGADAETPTDVPAKGWWQILRRAWAESKKDQVPLLAAGVAFYSFMALFPAMIAATLLYGLVADPATVARQADKLTSAMPSDAASIVTRQMRALADSPHQSLGIGLLIALLLALWSAAGGVGNIVTAINIAYDEEESRGFVRRKLLSLALTLGGIVFVVVAISLVGVAPAVLNSLVGGGPARWGFEAIRWVALLAGISLALAVLYRYAPDRDEPKFRWVSIGAAVASVIWLVASLGFSLYVSHFSSYSKTYGALAGVVVLLLWLWISTFIVLLGAEINAEAEQQTARDTTRGAAQPLGERGAVKADSLPGDEGEPDADHPQERRAR
ncbi:MAG TPA: YihY/virulence factor BrkB family protein [Marmoricola sp.]|nr:YihY/virulence factor BrkB family protein [Marmoricola sp.]